MVVALYLARESPDLASTHQLDLGGGDHWSESREGADDGGGDDT
eukprot:CAMPEP_0194487572 /NCGR_PEP_ID=MMETSP0253-20130528/7815_1 /TAXON_ID=2966 /ORGANISM="Noctiluca scintillans" /LENGTH=43 /DNA_ID= /DNA_START= /DNA_END= /DNA_ORIENTATION=